MLIQIVFGLLLSYLVPTGSLDCEQMQNLGEGESNQACIKQEPKPLDKDMPKMCSQAEEFDLLSEGKCLSCDIPNSNKANIQVKDVESQETFGKSMGESDSHKDTDVVDQSNLEEERQRSTYALAVVLYDEKNLLPFQKRDRSFQIGGHTFEIHQEWHSGGVAAVVWDAAVVLGEFLTAHPHLVRSRRVLELGAGTGLVGMVAATLEADVVVTERDEALKYLESAITANSQGQDWNISIKPLDWTDDLDPNAWADFDVVLGADIIYIEETFPDLLRTLLTVTEKNDAHILISCRIRYERDEKFLGMVKQHFKLKKLLYNSQYDVKIISARRIR